MPGRAWGRACSEAQLAGGVLVFPVLQRGKRTPQDRGATTFILLEYDIYGDVTPYTPSTRNSVWRIWAHYQVMTTGMVTLDLQLQNQASKEDLPLLMAKSMQRCLKSRTLWQSGSIVLVNHNKQLYSVNILQSYSTVAPALKNILYLKEVNATKLMGMQNSLLNSDMSSVRKWFKKSTYNKKTMGLLHTFCFLYNEQMLVWKKFQTVM